MATILETTCWIFSRAGRCIFTIGNELTIGIIKIGITISAIISYTFRIRIGWTVFKKAGINKAINRNVAFIADMYFFYINCPTFYAPYIFTIQINIAVRNIPGVAKIDNTPVRMAKAATNANGTIVIAS